MKTNIYKAKFKENGNYKYLYYEVIPGEKPFESKMVSWVSWDGKSFRVTTETNFHKKERAISYLKRQEKFLEKTDAFELVSAKDKTVIDPRD